MPTIRMQAIPDPKLAYSVKHGVLKGDGDITYTCASCSTPLIKNAHEGQCVKRTKVAGQFGGTCPGVSIETAHLIRAKVAAGFGQ